MSTVIYGDITTEEAMPQLVKTCTLGKTTRQDVH